MKFSDISSLSKDDILSALGLETKSSTTSQVLGTVGIFGIGIVVGAAAALLLAPKPGRDLREDLGQKIRTLRDEAATVASRAGSLATGKSSREEAIT